MYEWSTLAFTLTIKSTISRIYISEQGDKIYIPTHVPH
jgi:hypothetical protein